tara:strand:- start:51 stop:1406 length:1356 start_codon:yes stop_codon:yes gene_type:complete
MKIADIFVSLGVKADNKAVKTFEGNITNLTKRLAIMTAAFGGAVAALDKFTSGTVDSSVGLQNIANQTGLAISKLRQLGQAVQLSDLSMTAEQAAQEVGNLEQRLAAIRLTGQGAESFIRFGIQPTGDAFAVLEQVREAIQGMDNAKASTLISSLGINPQFINLLRLSRKEFDELGKNVFLSDKQNQNIIKLGTSITRLKLRIGALKDQAVAKLAPSLNKLVEDGFKWFEENGDNIIDIMAGIGKGFAMFASAVSNAIGFVASMRFSFEGLLTVLGLLALRFAPVITAIGGVLLVLDDLAVYARGGDSAIGVLLDKLKDFAGIELSSSLVVSIVSITAAVTALSLALGGVGKTLGILQGAFSFVGKIGSKVGKFLGSKLGLSVGAVGAGALAGSTLQQPPVSQSTLNNIGGAKNITQNVDVNITSDNASQVAQDFSSLYPNLVQQLDRGVR